MTGLGMVLRSLWSDERGVSMVEFGFIALPLSVIMMGGLEMGHQSYVRSQLQGSLSDIARLASVEDPQFQASGSTLEERILNTLEGRMEPIANDADVDLEISNYTDFSGVGKPEKLVRDVLGNGTYDEADGDCFEDLNENGEFDLDTGRQGLGGSNDVVVYEVVLTQPRLFPVPTSVGMGDAMEVKAAIAIRSQPYGAQATPPVICGSAS